MQTQDEWADTLAPRNSAANADRKSHDRATEPHRLAIIVPSDPETANINLEILLALSVKRLILWA